METPAALVYAALCRLPRRPARTRRRPAPQPQRLPLCAPSANCRAGSPISRGAAIPDEPSRLRHRSRPIARPSPARPKSAAVPKVPRYLRPPKCLLESRERLQRSAGSPHVARAATRRRPVAYLPHRYRRGSNSRRKALPLRRHRQNQQVCLPAGGQKDRTQISVCLPRSPHPGRSL